MRAYMRALATFCAATALGLVLTYTVFLSDWKRPSIRRDHSVEYKWSDVDHASELQVVVMNGRLNQPQDQQKEHVSQQEYHLDQQERLDQQEEQLAQQEHLDQQEHSDQQRAGVRISTAVAVPVDNVSISSLDTLPSPANHHTTGAQPSRQQTVFQGRVPSKNVTFTIARGFSFPYPKVTKYVRTVLSSSWVQQLKSYLLSLTPARQVTITVASYDFAANLLNWLISAQVITSPPLENILVISFDEPLHKMLIRRKISSLFVPYSSVLRNPKSLGVKKVWMTRMAVIRLINHWGFHVAQFDTDAIILRNPQPLFDRFYSFDVVGSRAKLPFELGKGQWGFTVCMGVILFRSTPRTGRSSEQLGLIGVFHILYGL